MHSYYRLRLAVLGVALAWGGAGGHAENLAPNPGFEELEADGACSRWSEAGYSRRNADGTCAFVTDASRAHGGSRFWEMSNTHKTKVKAIHCGAMHMRTDQAEEYVIRVWARGQGRFSLLAYGYAMRSFLVSVSSGEMAIDSDAWELRTLVFRPFKKGDKSARVRVDDGDWKEVAFPGPAGEDMKLGTPCLTVASGRVLFDDVAAYRVGHEPVAAAAPVIDWERTPFMTIGKTERAPVIDGRIEAAEWRRAGAATGFIQLDNEKSERETTVYACYDDEKLYFAFDSDYSNGLGRGEKGRDGKFGNSVDAIEIWILSPDGKWRQFLGMPAGGFLDLSPDGRSWNGDWEFANLVEDSGDAVGGVLTFARGNWDAEVSIAFAEIGATAPQPGDVWRMNFCRDYRARERSGRDWTSWSPTSGRFSTPERFGHVRFGGDGAAVRVTDLGDPMNGHIGVAGGASTGAAAEVELQVVVQSGAASVVAETREFALGPKAEESFLVQSMLKVAGAARMTLQVFGRDKASGETLCHARIPFTARPSFRMHVVPLHTKGFVDVELDATRMQGDVPEGVQASVSLSAADKVADIRTVKVTGMKPDALRGAARVDTSSLAPGRYLLKAVLADREGKVIASSTEPFPVPETPEWLGNTLGVSKEIPSPYKPVEVAGKNVAVVERRYALGDGGLPVSVEAAGKEVLAAPLQLVAAAAGKPLVWRFDPIVRVRAEPDHAVWKLRGRAGPLSIEGELRIEYDGFARWTVDVTPAAPTAVDLLAFRLLLPRERALYARAVSGQDCLVTYAAALFNQGVPGVSREVIDVGDRGGWLFSPAGWLKSDTFFHELWVGDDERGLALMCETDEYVHGKRHVEVVPRGANLEVTVHLISESTRVAAPLHYDYAWQATPLKPRPTDAKRWRICYGGGSYPKEGLLKRMYVGLDYHALTYTSYPEIKNPAASKRRIALFHKHGAKIVTADYLAACSKSTEEWQLYGRHWEILPRGGWSSTIQGPAAYACPRSPHFDFLTHGFKKIIGDFGYDGLYLDVSGPAACRNAYHPCGYERDGVRHVTYPLFTWRELYKRLYTYLHTGGRDGVVYRHVLGPPCIAGFMDAVTQGEEWGTEHERQYQRLSPEMFRTREMRTQFGPAYTWYTFHYYAYRAKAYGGAVPRNEILTMCLLHRVLPTTGDEGIWPIWDLMADWWTTSEFIPYWRPSAPVQATGDGVFASTYLRKGREALIVVGNWNFSPAETAVSIGYSALGLNPGRVRITEMLSGAEVPVPSGPLGFSLGKRDLKVLRVAAAPKAP